MHLDKKKGVIKSLSYRYYWEFDLNTFTITIKEDFGINSEKLLANSKK